jgi:hypothetical protein
MKFFKRLLATLGLFLMLLSNSAVTFAQAGQGLEISPPLVELNVDPGQTVSFEIRLRNIITSPLIARGSIDDFVSGGEEGQPKLLLDENAEPSPYSFKGWTGPLPELNLAPGEAKSAKISLTVPQDAAPGGHYGVVRYTGTAPDIDETGVALSASIGTLVLINVSGNVTYDAKIEEFFTMQNGKRKGFFETGPISFIERIKNQGSVHIKPIGTIRITNTFGKEVAVLSVNETGGNILPGSIRRFEQQLDKKFLIGRYTAEANIQYNGQNMTSFLTFWVIPYKLIAIILGVLILLFVIFRTGIKRYNRMIIKKAQSSNGKVKKDKK